MSVGLRPTHFEVVRSARLGEPAAQSSSSPGIPGRSVVTDGVTQDQQSGDDALRRLNLALDDANERLERILEGFDQVLEREDDDG